MNRGTTPTIRFNIPFDDPDEIWFTFAQNKQVKLTIEKDRMSLVDGKWQFIMTQAETLQLDSDLLVSVQARALKGTVAVASNIVTKDVGAILKDGEISG